MIDRRDNRKRCFFFALLPLLLVLVVSLTAPVFADYYDYDMEFILVMAFPDYEEPSSPPADNPSSNPPIKEPNPNVRTESFAMVSIAPIAFSALFLYCLVIAFVKGSLFMGIMVMGVGIYVYLALLVGMQEQLNWLRNLWGV